MSRYSVNLKPGGHITNGIDLTLKMQRVAKAPEIQARQECPVCTPAPTGLFWQNDVTGLFDQTAVIGQEQYQNPIPPFIYAARVEGELCGMDNDVFLNHSWLNAVTGDGTNAPFIWTTGNSLVIAPATGYAVDPGILTVTATLAGVVMDSYAITLVVTEFVSGGYY